MQKRDHVQALIALTEYYQDVGKAQDIILKLIELQKRHDSRRTN